VADVHDTLTEMSCGGGDVVTLTMHAQLVTAQPGVRESVALTHKLEPIWKRSAADSLNSNQVGQLGNFALYRYVGTREGVYRVYPAVRVPVMYDPTKQPWSVTVSALH